METQKQDQYNVVIGCYGARRGTILATLTQSRINQLYQGDLEIVIEGVGLPKFIGNKVNHPVYDEHISALESQVGNYDIRDAIEIIRNKGRQVATKEQLNRADRVFSVDDFALGEYRKLSEEESSDKYQTVLQGAGLKHPRSGIDLDDTECSVDFINRVVIPKKLGKEPEKLSPKDARYYAIDGTEYRAGDDAARIHEARDLVLLSQRLGEKIVEEVNNKGR